MYMLVINEIPFSKFIDLKSYLNPGIIIDTHVIFVFVNI